MKTAVEWLVEEINKINVSTEARLFIEKLKNKAKQMEDKQREESFVEGYKTRAEFSNLIFDEASELFAKELFNKTYKSE